MYLRNNLHLTAIVPDMSWFERYSNPRRLRCHSQKQEKLQVVRTPTPIPFSDSEDLPGVVPRESFYDIDSDYGRFAGGQRLLERNAARVQRDWKKDYVINWRSIFILYLVFVCIPMCLMFWYFSKQINSHL